MFSMVMVGLIALPLADLPSTALHAKQATPAVHATYMEAATDNSAPTWQAPSFLAGLLVDGPQNSGISREEETQDAEIILHVHYDVRNISGNTLGPVKCFASRQDQKSPVGGLFCFAEQGHVARNYCDNSWWTLVGEKTSTLRLGSQVPARDLWTDSKLTAGLTGTASMSVTATITNIGVKIKGVVQAPDLLQVGFDRESGLQLVPENSNWMSPSPFPLEDGEWYFRNNGLIF